MKLSDLTTGQAADVLLQITPAVANIAKDQKAIDAIGRVADFDNMNKRGVQMVVTDRYASFVTVLLRDHRPDVFTILAAVNLSTPEAIESQKITETFRQINEIRDDKELVDFLASWLPQKQTTSAEPSANAPDTSAQEESSPPSLP